ncbi:putative anaphase-promoting complex component cut20 apc4 protein [Neofusicoccum parvum UCRNP2]|uniref:Putative anaphase-promoting complex component cut20 apc4 protein n=1 Tax=Botryosphaeria parva (strain UCR-NP2) TaxID=1287680 RepID=R1EI96_BOTPV|nr:putative anaphase-promoting complex component cut20 apc4 protein [Neofusicoccum parvum UCRNP2]
MRMVFEKLEDSSDISTYMALVPQDAKSEVRLHRIVHSDLFDRIEGTGTAPPDQIRHIWSLDTAEDWQPLVRHVFPASERFAPVKIDVNGRKDRRVVCVLGDDLKHYKIYDLDYESGKEGEGDTTVDTVMSG